MYCMDSQRRSVGSVNERDKKKSIKVLTASENMYEKTQINTVSKHSGAVHGSLEVCLGGAVAGLCALLRPLGPYPGTMHGSLEVCTIDLPIVLTVCTETRNEPGLIRFQG